MRVEIVCRKRSKIKVIQCFECENESTCSYWIGGERANSMPFDYIIFVVFFQTFVVAVVVVYLLVLAHLIHYELVQCVHTFGSCIRRACILCWLAGEANSFGLRRTMMTTTKTTTTTTTLHDNNILSKPK